MTIINKSSQNRYSSPSPSPSPQGASNKPSYEKNGGSISTSHKSAATVWISLNLSMVKYGGRDRGHGGARPPRGDINHGNPLNNPLFPPIPPFTPQILVPPPL